MASRDEPGIQGQAAAQLAGFELAATGLVPTQGPFGEGLLCRAI